MSKARLIITAVVLEGRSQAEVARDYEVSKGWVSKLVTRYRLEGDAAFEPRSRRPLSSPNKTPPEVVDRIIGLRRELTAAGLDAGCDTIAWHLEHHHQVTVSTSTIHRYLVRAGLVVPAPKKRPKSSYVRFEAELPNETWQSDFTHWRLADDRDVELLAWLDDHSRYSLSLTAHQPVTGPAVVHTFLAAGENHGLPASTLTDNGMVYTTRFAGGRGGRNGFETTLATLGIVQKNSRPNHPTTCGKVERFHQSVKRWLNLQPRAQTLTELQHQLDRFRHIYNHERPHRSIAGRTPAAIYQARPKAHPPGTTTTSGTARIRHDRVHETGSVTIRHNGRLHHIGIGRAHGNKPVVLLVAGLDIRVIDATTGELLRHLTLDPTRDYQPLGKRPGRPRKS